MKEVGALQSPMGNGDVLPVVKEYEFLVSAVVKFVGELFLVLKNTKAFFFANVSCCYQHAAFL